MEQNCQRFGVERDDFGYWTVLDRSSGRPATHRGRSLVMLSEKDAASLATHLNRIDPDNAGVPILSPTG